MKSILPWLCALALLAAAVFLFTANLKQSAELDALRAQSTELESVRTELEQIKKTGSPAQVEEITRLRKDTEDLLRLRNEVRQLREDRIQLARQAQTAQAQVEVAQGQLQQAQAQAQALSAQQQQALASRPATVADPAAALTTCINHLRMLDGAKQQWALENRKDANATPTAEQTAVYLKDHVMPRCPAGGTYTLGTVATPPTCTIPGHALPAQ